MTFVFGGTLKGSCSVTSKVLFSKSTLRQRKPKIVRVNYRETVAEILSKTYFGALREFCEANGSKSSGHCLLEESMNYHAHYYGNLMQCLREMSIPGVDGLAMKTENYLSEGWPIFMAVKYASSVATLTDKDRLVMMETCATDLPSAMAYNDEQYKQFRTTLNNIFSTVSHTSIPMLPQICLPIMQKSF